MILPIREGLGEENAQMLANKLRRIRLMDCAKELYVLYRPVAKVETCYGGFGCKYEIVMEFHPIERYPLEAHITWNELSRCFEDIFVPKLRSAVRSELQRMAKIEREDAIAKANSLMHWKQEISFLSAGQDEPDC